MHTFKLRGLAAAAFVAAGALLAACSGGSKSSLPAVQPQSSGVSTTLKITIGGAGTQSALRNGQSISATNSKSIVIKYVGDGNPTAGPTNPFLIPSNAATAAGTPVNITTGAGGNCVVLGTSLACTITGVSLPVGVEDIYVLDYDNTNGTGNLIYGSVSTVQVNANGTLTAPGTTTPTVFLNPLSGNTGVAGASISFSGGTITVAPNSNAVATTQAAYAFYGPIGINAFDEDNLPISGPIPPVVVTDNDTTGNTCLVYVKTGTALGTSTCTFPAAGTKATATVSNTGDQLYIQYNNAPMAAAGFSLTAPVPAPSASPAVATDAIKFQPMSFRAGTIGSGTSGGLTAIGSTVFVATNSTTANQAIFAYSFNSATGQLSNSSTVVSTPGLTASIAGLAVGPDNNLWFVQQDGKYGVFALSQAAGAIAKGTVGISGSAPGTTPAGIASYGGYIWIFDLGPNLIRIDPTQGVSGTNVVVAPVTIPSGATMWPFAGLTQAAGTFYTSTTSGSTLKVVPNTSISATSANLVTSVSESLLLYGSPASGIFQASDGNIWTVQGATTNSTFRYTNPSSLLTTSVAAFDNPAGNLTIWGGVAQGGPDNVVVTTSQGTATGATSAAALSWTSLTGSASGYVGEGAANTCVTTGNRWTGQGVISLGSYFIHGSANGICVAVP